MRTTGGNSLWNFFCRESVLDEGQLKRLAAHRYSADDRSFLTQVAFGRFWDWVTTLYPRWLAPNLLTLAGFLVNAITTLILAWYSADCNAVAPKWAYLLCSAGIFIYQVLDSTDGKQARRTKTSTPLGELFDHGCDSLTEVFIGIAICLGLLLGDQRWNVLQLWLVAVILFYASHWQTYVTGTLRFGRFDSVEAQFTVVVILFISGIFGPEIWSVELFGWTLRRHCLTSSAGIAAVVLTTNLYNILTKGKNGRTVANTNILFPLLPLLSFTVPPVIIYNQSRTNVFDEHAVLFCLVFGLIAAKITCHVILAHMTLSPIGAMDSILIAPLLMAFSQYLNFVSEYFMLYVCLIYCSINLFVYSWMTFEQICSYLNIYAFRLPESVWKDASRIINGVDSSHKHH